MLNSQHLVVVVSCVAVAVTIIGWKKVLVCFLAGLVTLALLGLVQVVMIVAAV